MNIEHCQNMRDRDETRKGMDMIRVEDGSVTLKWPGRMTTAEASRYLLTNGFVAVELYRAEVLKPERERNRPPRVKIRRKGSLYENMLGYIVLSNCDGTFQVKVVCEGNPKLNLKPSEVDPC